MLAMLLSAAVWPQFATRCWCLYPRWTCGDWWRHNVRMARCRNG